MLLARSGPGWQNRAQEFGVGLRALGYLEPVDLDRRRIESHSERARQPAR